MGTTIYLRRRPRIIRTAPANKARALPPDAGLISGTAAPATIDAPIANKHRASVFRIHLFLSYYDCRFEGTLGDYGGQSKN